ncbi:hypothetical protein D9M69_641580 [compost metagenome]
MAKNTISILEDDAVLKRFKEHAYLRAQDFDLKKILPMYIDFYNEILEQALVEEN